MTIGVSCPYTMLICSLPALPSQPFAARQTPLSRMQLERRLALLRQEDARRLELIESVAHWDRMTMATTDRELLQRGKNALGSLRSPVVRNLVRWRLELRTLIAAMRMRRKNVPLDADQGILEHCACGEYVRRNWGRPDFGLGHIHPWLFQAHRLLTQGEHLALERLLFQIVWNHHSRVAQNQHFDFEAVVLYVLRWDLVDRWIRYDGTAARGRFVNLLRQGLVEDAWSSAIPALSF